MSERPDLRQQRASQGRRIVALASLPVIVGLALTAWIYWPEATIELPGAYHEVSVRVRGLH